MCTNLLVIALLLAQLDFGTCLSCTLYVNASHNTAGPGTPSAPFSNLTAALQHVSTVTVNLLTTKATTGNFTDCTINIAQGRYEPVLALNSGEMDDFSLTLAPWKDEPGLYYIVPEISVTEFRGLFCI